MASEREPAASPSSASEAPNPRKRGRTACTRCKSRKQRCDDQVPTCSNCQRAGAKCDKADVADEAPPVAYTRALEDRIAFLETRLEQVHGNTANLAEPVIQGCSPTNTISDKEGNALNDIVTLMALGEAEGDGGGQGTSAGPSLSMILHQMVQATVWNKSLPEASSPEGNIHHSRNESQDWTKRISVEDLIAKSAKEPPNDELGGKIIRAFFQQLHPRYPFLDSQEISGLHKSRQSLIAGMSKSSPREQRLGIFKLYLVYATGATLLHLTEKLPTSPEGYYMTALQHTSAARESRTIDNIEAMALLVVYHLRSASSHGIWYMIGLAMRTCIDLGMHRKSHEQNLPPSETNRRRLLFWSMYSLERTIAVSLGRPVSIPDRQIDVPLPESGRPSTSSTLSASPLAESTQSPSQIRINATPALALHLFRLRRIESSIYYSIYRVDKPLTALRTKLDPLYADLSAWRTSLMSSFTASSPELNYPMLHYNRALRLLIQPFLPILPLSDPFHGLCLRAAGDICQAHKRLHQSLDYGHSFIAVQTVFVAGLTLLQGLWRWTSDVWSVALADDIRACSLVLFVMGERAAWVRRYRDAFEMLVNSSMDKLRSSEASTARSSASPSDEFGQNPRRKRPRTAPTAHHWARPDPGFRQTPIGVSDNAQYAAWVTGLEADQPPYDGGGIAAGEGGDAWPIVMELANWIEQDGGSPIWMPDFEVL